jgi:acyl-CoA thioesterase-1
VSDAISRWALQATTASSDNRKTKMKFMKVVIFTSMLVSVIFALTNMASAQIVALGASNTEGYGVNPSEAWPAQLESMLRAKGSGAHITNAGVNGETTGQVLASLSSSVPEGTKVVILAIGGHNDLRTGGSIGAAMANIAAIKKQLAARGIRVVDALGTVKSMMHQPSMTQADHVHLTAEGHRRVAMQLAGSVR